MTPPTLVVHGHFYQPPRENPWTEAVPREPTAAPHHDWNARITAECYRPNGWARVVDDAGRVVDIVNNYAHLSFDVGPTLFAWLERHAPEVVERIRAGDAAGGGAVAHAHHHVILPLADDRDVRTEVRWGLAAFEHRFGRPARGMWLPEAAVDDRVLAVLAEEGVAFTVLAPDQAARWRPLDGDEHSWADATGLDTRQPYRWQHPTHPELGVDVVFYDGPLSHDVAFGAGGLSSQTLVARTRLAAPDGGLVCVATDGETFGHHHVFAERALAHALPIEAPSAGIEVTTVAAFLDQVRPAREVAIRPSSWSCPHGVERWRSDCGCRTGGPPGTSQAWRAPLRAALDVVRAACREVFERRGAAVLADPWAARDAYVSVLLDEQALEDFASEHVAGDRVEALTLLEMERHALCMYTSCGWFFWDLAELETVQVLRYAAKAMDLIAELGEEPPLAPFLDVLATARSNQPGAGDGREVWERHVAPARVDAARAVAHVALAELLEGSDPGDPVGAYRVDTTGRWRVERDPVIVCCGSVAVTHRRTGRRSEHVYAAVHLGGLEVLGATRPADPARDRDDVAAVVGAAEAGDRVSAVLRLVAERFGPHEFGLEAVLPDQADQIVRRAAAELGERYAAAFDRLFADHRALLESLGRAGYPLPDELRTPAELALGRRLDEAMAAAASSGWDEAAVDQARGVAATAAAMGVRPQATRAGGLLGEAFLAEVRRACEDGHEPAGRALRLLELGRELAMALPVERAQELLHERLRRELVGDEHLRLAEVLGMAPDALGAAADVRRAGRKAS